MRDWNKDMKRENWIIWKRMTTSGGKRQTGTRERKKHEERKKWEGEKVQKENLERENKVK